jgi:hypothetical protein
MDSSKIIIHTHRRKKNVTSLTVAELIAATTSSSDSMVVQ